MTVTLCSAAEDFERAKQRLRDPKRSIIDAELGAGLQNSRHFARIFRKLEGITPDYERNLG
jgi:AraC family transcriptional regulator